MEWFGLEGPLNPSLVQPPCNEWGNLQPEQGSEAPPAWPWMFPGMGQEQGQGCRSGVKQHLEHLEVARKHKGAGEHQPSTSITSM